MARASSLGGLYSASGRRPPALVIATLSPGVEAARSERFGKPGSAALPATLTSIRPDQGEAGVCGADTLQDPSPDRARLRSP